MKHKLVIKHFTYSKDLAKHLQKQGHISEWNMFDQIKTSNEIIQRLIGKENHGRKSD